MKKMLIMTVAVPMLFAVSLMASGSTLPPNPADDQACAIDMNDYGAYALALWIYWFGI